MKKYFFLLYVLISSVFTLQLFAQQGQLSGPPPVIGTNIPNTPPLPSTFSVFGYNALGQQEFTFACGVSSIEATARFNDVGTTDTYTVEAIPYAPVRFDLPLPSEPGAQIPQNQDDRWSQILPVGADTDPSAMDFCFFQNIYNQFILNTNGVVSFDINAPASQTPAQQPGGFATWNLLGAGSLPIKLGATGNTGLFSNAIFFPMHDPNPADPDNALNNAYAYWNIIGTAPNRKFVMAIHDTAMFLCGNPSTTQQVIFYETTNIIEVHMKDKPICSSWNGGFAVVGIQNSARDTSFTPSGRDTDVWTANFESWRFIPSGNLGTAPTFAWYSDYGLATQTLISTNPTHIFAPTVNPTVYTAVVTYTEACSNNVIVSTQDFVISLANDLLGEIVDPNPPNNPIENLHLCAGDTFTVLADATDNSGVAGNTITYNWTLTTNGTTTNVTPAINPENLLINSNDITGTGVYEVIIELFNSSGTSICQISDSVTVTVGNPSFDYAIVNYCSTTDPNPLPQNVAPPVGTPSAGIFTINNGGTINNTTGEVDLTASGTGTDLTGNFTITYTIGTAPNDCFDTFAINISTGDANFAYPSATVCINDGTATPTPTSINTPGGEFTITNGGVIDINTGVVNLTASGSGIDTTGVFVITYDTSNLGGACTGSTMFTLTITAQDNTTFGYDSGVTANPTDFCVSDGSSGLPNPTPGTSGGTYAINNGGIINTTTGEIDFTNPGGTPASNTPYTITYTTLGSCANSSQFNITLHSDEVANFNYNNTYCSTGANPVPTITATGGGTFDINNGGVFLDTGTNINSTSGEINLSAIPNNGLGIDNTGNFTITYTTPGTFCSASSNYNITINATPVITTLSNQEECDSFTFPAITGTNLTGSESYYTATGGGGTAYAAGATVNFADFATYPVTLYIYDETGSTPNCSDEKTFSLTLHQTPVITALGNQVECDSFTFPAIAGTNLTGSESYYTATGGGGTAYAVGTTVNFADFATYPVTLYIYDETGSTPNCFSEETFTLTINKTPIVNDIADVNVSCDTYILPVITGANLTGNEMYYTETNGGGTVYAGNSTLNFNDFLTYPVTLYIFDATGSVGNECTSEEEFSLTIVPTDDPTFTYAPNTCLSSTNPTPTSVITPGGTFSIDNAAVINPLTGEIDLASVIGDTTYQITYLTNGLCPDTSSISIIIDDIVDASIAFADETVCINDATNPQAIPTADLGGTFSIDQNAVIDSVTGIIDLTSTVANTTYTVSYTVDNGNCTDTQTATIEVVGLPEFDVPYQAFICPTAGIDTDIIITNANGNYTYQWSYTDSNGDIIVVGNTDTLTLNDPSQVGIYTVTAQVATNDPSLFCEFSQLVSVGLAEQVVISNVFVNDFNRPNNTITVEVTGGTGDFTYIIEDENGNETTQINNPVFENVTSALYTIHIIDNQSCSEDVFRTDVAVLDYPLFFTPNGDANYDTWNINNAHLIPNSKIYIFDRYGKVLAQIDPNGLGWDGIYLGKQVPATDYWFTAEYLDPNTHTPKTVKGHFSIVRKGEI